MRKHTVIIIAISLGLAAAPGCALESDQSDQTEQVASKESALSSCVYGSFSPVGGHIVGWSVDLCNGEAPGSAQFSVHTGTGGRRNIYYGTCEYYESSFIWCSGNQYITVNVNGVDYTGWYGFDIDAHAGGQLGVFNAQYIWHGLFESELYPFPYSL